MIRCCYVQGPISGISDVGGIVGYDDFGRTVSSFWDIEQTGI